MRHFARSLVPALLLAAGAQGCRYPATAMLVRVDTDLAWGPGQQLTEIELTAWTGAMRAGDTSGTVVFSQHYTLGSGTGLFALPGTRVLERRGDVSTPVTVQAVAYQNGAELFRTAAIAPFTSQQTVVLDLFLAGRCRAEAASCTRDQSCGRTGCESLTRAPLPAIDPRDAGALLEGSAATFDAALDNPVDSAPDAPSEAASPDALDALDAAMDTGPEAADDALYAVDTPATETPDAAPDVVDAAMEAAVTPMSARPLAPLSTSTVGSQRPTLRWLAPVGLRETIGLRVCGDRAMSLRCTDVGSASLVSGATSYRLAAPLSAGAWFWQLQGTTSAAPVWEFFVPARDAGADSSWGSTTDVNGDGLADLVVSASHYGAYGRVYVFAGSAAGPSTTPTSSIDGSGTDNAFGASLASAGDVNGDGYGDVLANTVYPQRLYVLAGGPEGLRSTPLAMLTPGTSTANNFAYASAGIGDFNGDGYGDVAAGAPSGTSAPGQLFLYLGGPAGPLDSPRLVTADVGGSVGFGGNVAGNDLDGDGLADLLAGEPYADANTGRLVYARGSLSALDTSTTLLGAGLGGNDELGGSLANLGDVNGDGLADSMAGSFQGAGHDGAATLYYGRSGVVALTPQRVAGHAGSGEGFGVGVANAGDTNGDGFADALVGTTNATSAGGSLYVLLGSAAGLRLSAAVAVPNEGGAGAIFSNSFAGVGDMDGDGYGECVVTAVGANSHAGAVYLYRGSAAGPVVSSRLLIPAPDPGTIWFGDHVAGR